MKTLVCLLLVLGPQLRADEAADRMAIERVVGAINVDTAGSAEKRAASGLFTADAEKDLDRFPAMVRGSGEVWSELSNSRGRVTMQSMRFVTADVALVDASSTQFGSVILMRRTSLLLVMKREGSDWRVASIRQLVANR